MPKPRSYWLEKLDKARHEYAETERHLKKSGKRLEESAISRQLRQELRVKGGLMGRQLWHKRVSAWKLCCRNQAFLTRKLSAIGRRIEYLQERIKEVQTPTWHDILKRGSLRI
jgi:hypothetical protein